MKRRALLGLLLGGALTAVSSSLAWLQVRGELGQAGPVDLAVPGTIAAPAMLVLGIAAMATALGLLLAGPFFRRILGGLAVLLGAVGLWQALLPALDPVRAAAPALREATGLGDLEAIRALVPEGAIQLAPSFALGVVGCLVTALAGVLALRGGSGWADGGRRFEDASDAAGDRAPAREGDRRIAQWDALSHGDDPTELEAAAADEGAERTPAAPDGEPGPERA